MGKRIISQRRGRGTSTYRSNSWKFAGKLGYGAYCRDDILKGKIVELIHSKGHSAPIMKILYSNEAETLLPAYEGCFIGGDFELNMKNELEGNVVKGNSYLLKHIPEGSEVYNVELSQGDGGKLSRTGGSSVKVVSHAGKFTKVLLPSKKEKLINSDCRVILGLIGGAGRVEKPFAKAGTKFHAMKKKNKLYPRTSGGKMAAYDHPFGNTRSLRKGTTTVAPKNAPPGRKVGMIRPRRTGKKN